MKHETSIQDAARVQDWENRQVKGAAMACKKVYEDEQEKINELRARQEAYEKSLPTDPVEGLELISRTLKTVSDADEKYYAPRAALEIIRELSVKGGLDDSQQMTDAIYWLTDQALGGLTAIEDSIQTTRDIARKFNPMHRPYEA